VLTFVAGERLLRPSIRFFAPLRTVEHGLGEGFTPDVRSAWVKVYGVFAATMQSGAAEVCELRAAE
jgi:hemoglobin-like flavoprotein